MLVSLCMLVQSDENFLPLFSLNLPIINSACFTFKPSKAFLELMK